MGCHIFLCLLFLFLFAYWADRSAEVAAIVLPLGVVGFVLI